MASRSNIQYEIEDIVRVRPTLLGKEYLVKRKGYPGADPYVWAAEQHLCNYREMLAHFKERNRMTESMAMAEAPPMPCRRRRRSPLNTAAAKRRHTSASSVDVTPTYQDGSRHKVAGRIQPTGNIKKHQKQQNKHKLESQLVKQLEVRRRSVEKLHSSSKDITATSLLQRQQPRPDCLSDRVSTRKTVRSSSHPHSPQASSLSQVLSQPPLHPLNTIADALQGCAAIGRTPPADGNDEESAKPTAWRLIQLVTARGPDGNRGHPVRLATALDRASYPLDEALPGPSDSRQQNRCLVHLAATAGPHSATLLLHLLAAGASPDVADADGRTPLMLAARVGDAPAVERLLQFDARLDLSDRRGFSALTLAAAGDHWEAAGVLLRRGAEFAKLAKQPGFDADQLKPWTDRLSQPLLRALAHLQDSRVPRFPASLVGAQPPFLTALAPGARRAFTFPTRPSPAGSVHLLVAGLVELDGVGGVRMRRATGAASGRLFAKLALKGAFMQPILSADAFAVYPLPAEFMAQAGQENKIELALSPDLPARNRLKLVAQVVCASEPPG